MHHVARGVAVSQSRDASPSLVLTCIVVGSEVDIHVTDLPTLSVMQARWSPRN